MANLRDIRRRIKSVKNTSQITKAMQMVASTKMRRAQQVALALRPYASLLDDMAGHLYAATGKDEVSHPLLQGRPGGNGKTAVIVITSEKGLCGALNANLLRDVLKADSADKVYISVGRKGRQVLARMKKNLLADFELKDTPSFSDSKVISRFVLQKFEEKQFDKVEIYYNRFVNTLSQVPTLYPIVPIGAGVLDVAKALGHAERAEHLDPTSAKSGGTQPYNFEPDADVLLGKLLPYYIHLELYEKILESRASEHSARMVAMKNATDNAKQLVKDLTLEYNKARQASITNELLEISSAAAAMG